MSDERTPFAGIKSKYLHEFNEIERDYAISLEYDSQVAYYFPAQMGLEAEKNPERFLEIDFWVIYENKLERLVFFHEDNLKLDDWKAASACLSDKRAVFTPISKRSIEAEPRRSNLRLIWKFADEELRMECLTLLNMFFAETNISYRISANYKDFLKPTK